MTGFASSKPFSLAVKAIIRNDQGQVLLLRRSAQSKHWPGMWEFPGGKLDPGEPFDKGLKREVREETSGMTIRFTGVAGASGCEMEHVNVVLLFMEAEGVDGDVTVSCEHDDFAWVLLSEIPKWDLSDQMVEFTKDYVSRRLKKMGN